MKKLSSKAAIGITVVFLLTLTLTHSPKAWAVGAQVVEFSTEFVKLVMKSGDSAKFATDATKLFKTIASPNPNERSTAVAGLRALVNREKGLDSAFKARLLVDLNRLEKETNKEVVDSIQSRIKNDVEFMGKFSRVDPADGLAHASVAVKSCNNSVPGHQMGEFMGAPAQAVNDYYALVAKGDTGAINSFFAAKLGKAEASKIKNSQSGAELYAILKSADDKNSEIGKLAGKVIATAKKANGGRLLDANGDIVQEAGLARFAMETNDNAAAARLSLIFDQSGGDMKKIAKKLTDGEDESSAVFKAFKKADGPCCFNLCKYL